MCPCSFVEQLLFLKVIDTKPQPHLPWFHECLVSQAAVEENIILESLRNLSFIFLNPLSHKSTRVTF